VKISVPSIASHLTQIEIENPGKWLFEAYISQGSAFFIVSKVMSPE
jgi:hypothetical protein